MINNDDDAQQWVMDPYRAASELVIIGDCCFVYSKEYFVYLRRKTQTLCKY